MKRYLMIMLLTASVASAQEEVKTDENNFRHHVGVGYLIAPSFNTSGTAYASTSMFNASATYTFKGAPSIAYELSKFKERSFNLGFRGELSVLEASDYDAKVGTATTKGSADGKFTMLSVMFAPNIRLNNFYILPGAGLTVSSFSGNDILLKAVTPLALIYIGAGYAVSDSLRVEAKIKYHIVGQKEFTDSGVRVLPDSALSTIGGLDLGLKFGF